MPIQLLYINLVTDSIPAIALAFEKEQSDVMDRDVRKNKSFFTPFLIGRIGIISILKTIAIISLYFIGLNIYNVSIATTMCFLTLILSEMLLSYSCRDLKHNVINKNIFVNKYLNKSMFILILIQVLVFVSPLKTIFKISNLSFMALIICILVVVLVFMINEIFKKILGKLKD